MCFKHIRENLKKVHNKTFLYALITLLNAFVILLMFGTTYFSNSQNSCTNELFEMQINKTQQFVENQEILFTKSIVVVRQTEANLEKDIYLSSEYGKEIRAASQKYNNFVDNIKFYDTIILNKQKTCSSKGFLANILTVVSIVVLIINMCLSFFYFKKYVQQ